MRLKACIYIKGDLYRIVDLSNKQDEIITERISINHNDLKGNFVPITIPEYLLIDETEDISSIQKSKIIHESNVDKNTLNNLFEDGEIKILLIGEDKSAEMIHRYVTDHPIHPWDSPDYFEYEKDMEDFERLIYCFGKAELMGDELNLTFVTYPINEITSELIQQWKDYRKNRILLYDNNIAYTNDSLVDMETKEEY